MDALEHSQDSMVVGKGKDMRIIDIVERVKLMGANVARAILGLHNFTGADWGGKFVGVSKKRLVTAFLLSEDKDLIEAFTSLGSIDMTPETVLETVLDPIEKFVHSVYGGNRWTLFRSRNLQAENLPPTRASLKPHICRTNYATKVGKSYVKWEPELPSPVGHGWRDEDGKLSPVTCLLPPAPAAVMELVKCSCKAVVCKGNCSCSKNGLKCTSLCGCKCRVVDQDLHYEQDQTDDQEVEDH
jgi:hypothetical protein